MIGAAERLALLRVGDGVVGRTLGDADGLGGGPEPGPLERAERDAHSASDLADHVLGRHADVLEHGLSRR